MRKADEGGVAYLCDLDIVDFELCVWVRLLGVEDLLYRDWSESVFAVCTLHGSVLFPHARLVCVICLSCSTLTAAL